MKYWAKADLEIDYLMFVTNSAWSSDLRVRGRAYGRIARIADIIGEEEVRENIADTKREYGKWQDARIWEIYLHGTSEQRDALQEEMNRKLSPNEYSDEVPERREPTAAEVRELMLRELRSLVKILSSDPGLSKAEACDALAFNILVGIDGSALKFPRLRLVNKDGLVINEDVALGAAYQNQIKATEV